MTRSTMSALAQLDKGSPVQSPQWRARYVVRPDRSGIDVRGTYPPGRPHHGETIDTIAVERACAGLPVAPLNRAERVEAVHQLQHAGETVTFIALRLGLARRTVQRIVNV